LSVGFRVEGFTFLVPHQRLQGEDHVPVDKKVEGHALGDVRRDHQRDHFPLRVPNGGIHAIS